MILNPQHLKIFGNNISIGDYATLITAPDKRIDLSTWETDKINGEIEPGANTLTKIFGNRRTNRTKAKRVVKRIVKIWFRKS